MNKQQSYNVLCLNKGCPSKKVFTIVAKPADFKERQYYHYGRFKFIFCPFCGQDTAKYMGMPMLSFQGKSNQPVAIWTDERGRTIKTNSNGEIIDSGVYDNDPRGWKHAGLNVRSHDAHDKPQEGYA